MLKASVRAVSTKGNMFTPLGAALPQPHTVRRAVEPESVCDLLPCDGERSSGENEYKEWQPEEPVTQMGRKLHWDERVWLFTGPLA